MRRYYAWGHWEAFIYAQWIRSTVVGGGVRTAHIHNQCRCGDSLWIWTDNTTICGGGRDDDAGVSSLYWSKIGRLDKPIRTRSINACGMCRRQRIDYSSEWMPNSRELFSGARWLGTDKVLAKSIKPFGFVVWFPGRMKMYVCDECRA